MTQEVEVLKNKLKKSVAAIQSKPDRHVSLIERKLMNICLFHAYNELGGSKTHKIHIDELHLYFDYKGNNFKAFDEAFNALQEIKFTFNIFGAAIDSSENVAWARVQFLGPVLWSPKTREFTFSFGEGIAEKFHLPSQFADIALGIQSKFASVYSLVLYEQCVRYRACPQGSRWFSIKDLRDVFAIDKNKYKLFKDFNKWVLKPAIKEINEVSDVIVEPEIKRENRAVKYIKFHTKVKDNVLSFDAVSSENKSAEVVEKLLEVLVGEFKIHKSVADKLIISYDKKVILDAVEYIKHTATYKNKSPKNSLSGYLVSAITKGYKSNIQVKEEKRKEKEKKTREKERVDTILKNIKNGYSKYQHQFVNNLFETQEDLVSKLKSEFEVEHKDFIEAVKKFKRQTKKSTEKSIWDYAQITNAFEKFTLENIEKHTAGMTSMEDYVSSLSKQEQKIWFEFNIK